MNDYKVGGIKLLLQTSMANKVSIKTALSEGNKIMPLAPTYFLSLTLENVRCFGPKQTLYFSDKEERASQWTIILGNNGVGKTTILQGLSLLVPIRIPQLDQFIQELPDPENRFSNIVPPKATEARYPRYLDLSPNTTWDPYAKEDTEVFQLAGEFGIGVRLTERNEEPVRASIQLLRNERGVTFTTVLSAFPDFPCFGYGASRRMGDVSLSDKNEDSAVASLFSDDISLLNAEEWLLQADYAAYAAKNKTIRKAAEKRRNEIRDILIKLLPDVTDIRFSRLSEEQLRPGIEVQTPYGWVSIKDLSLGYKTLIAWMVDFASRMFDRYPDSPNPLAEPAVVLVDEIDLHLHPKWQRTLMGYLSERFPNTQFIATAHSPLVVQAAQDANIVLLQREGNHVVIENNVEAVRNWRVDQILTSDLFGLESARPPETDRLLDERTKILSKSKLTKKDRERLKKLEEEIGELPTGETPEDIEAMDVIRRAAERLKAEGY
jgi:predicted ATP-binding protein involved in virulence